MKESLLMLVVASISIIIAFAFFWLFATPNVIRDWLDEATRCKGLLYDGEYGMHHRCVKRWWHAEVMCTTEHGDKFDPLEYEARRQHHRERKDQRIMRERSGR